MPRIHPTAIIESNVQLGEGTSVWDNVHIRRDAVLGDECIVGGKSTIAYEVQIGHRVKINSTVYICNGVTIEDGVFIGCAQQRAVDVQALDAGLAAVAADRAEAIKAVMAVEVACRGVLDGEQHTAAAGLGTTQDGLALHLKEQRVRQRLDIQQTVKRLGLGE